MLGKLLTLVWTAAAARLQSTQDFGTFSLALSLALLAGAVTEWGFDPVLGRRALAKSVSGGRSNGLSRVAVRLLGGGRGESGRLCAV